MNADKVIIIATLVSAALAFIPALWVYKKPKVVAISQYQTLNRLNSLDMKRTLSYVLFVFLISIGLFSAHIYRKDFKELNLLRNNLEHQNFAYSEEIKLVTEKLNYLETLVRADNKQTVAIQKKINQLLKKMRNRKKRKVQ